MKNVVLTSLYLVQIFSLSDPEIDQIETMILLYALKLFAFTD